MKYYKLKLISTACLTLLVSATGFVAGRYLLTSPVKVKHIPLAQTKTYAASAPLELITDTKTGKLQSIENNYFLITTDDQAIKLELNPAIQPKKLIGKRILATGLFDPKEKSLIVLYPESLEQLSTTPIPIPTKSQHTGEDGL